MLWPQCPTCKAVLNRINASTWTCPNGHPPLSINPKAFAFFGSRKKQGQ